jgi:eukaryotic-like serine/threonine-protein kinase
LGLSAGGLVFDRVLAEGGIGVVYAARELASGREVAAKVLQARHLGDAGIESRFQREIRYLSRVAHRNVVAVLGEGRVGDGRPFFSMELYRGSTLGALVRAEGPLSIGRGLGLADQILAGLGALHEAGIAHLDLQPDNVFVIRDERGADCVKLLDLGFSHEPGVDTGDGVTPDSPGSLVGTLRFMSPEQATRCRAITERSDLFATALLLYYALSGKLPFRGVSDLDVVVSIVRSAPIPLRKERRRVPPLLDEVLAKALAKHPDARFPSAEGMRAALARVVAAA